MHDIFQEMHLNGARIEQPVFLKAFIGSASEHGGARPWESLLVYNAMQRSGMQIEVQASVFFLSTAKCYSIKEGMVPAMMIVFLLRCFCKAY